MPPLKQKQLFVVGPQGKPEFLADLEVLGPSPAAVKAWEALPDKIVLENYTRDAWAWKPLPSVYTALTVQSTDGRNKVPGFLGYLAERKKSAYGRLAGGTLVAVAYVQKDKTRMTLRVCSDMSKLPDCKLEPLKAVTAAPKPKPAPAAAPVRKGGGGLLGKLVGAQQRTNHHVAIATAPTKGASTNGTPAAATAQADGAAASVEQRTAATVLADFRQAMHDKMLDFDLAEDEEVLTVPLRLSDHTAGLSEEDRKRVTMEILKYMVYEAAEEVNEEWIAHKEASEFMDETNIVVYKEGAAPEEVLEEINKAELPDEVRGQQRAIQEARQRQVVQAESRNAQLKETAVHKQVYDDDDELDALNTKKRDRRTIEDYEREKREGGKKSRS